MVKENEITVGTKQARNGAVKNNFAPSCCNLKLQLFFFYIYVVCCWRFITTAQRSCSATAEFSYNVSFHMTRFVVCSQQLFRTPCAC